MAKDRIASASLPTERRCGLRWPIGSGRRGDVGWPGGPNTIGASSVCTDGCMATAERRRTVGLRARRMQQRSPRDRCSARNSRMAWRSHFRCRARTRYRWERQCIGYATVPSLLRSDSAMALRSVQKLLRPPPHPPPGRTDPSVEVRGPPEGGRGDAVDGPLEGVGEGGGNEATPRSGGC